MLLIKWNKPKISVEVDQLVARCTPDLMARASELGSSDATPVLIVGMPQGKMSEIGDVTTAISKLDPLLADRANWRTFWNWTD
jgi:hypothetical protein